jgi:ABC-type nitrate/sulfonate/bicarbonate transport system substrate-binding protein
MTTPISALTRRRFLAGLGMAGAAVVLEACSSAASTGAANPGTSPAGKATGSSAAGSPRPSTQPTELTKVAVALGFLPNVEYGGNWIADNKGYYRAEGLEPTFLPGGPNAPAPEVALSAGNAAIATETNDLRLFDYLAKHSDVVLIGCIYQTSPLGLLSLAKRPVRTVADLKGARILAGTPNRPLIAALMKLNNVSDYTFVPAGADVGPLLAGQGDALLAFSNNQPITLEQEKKLTKDKDFYFTHFSDLNYHLMSDAILVSRAYLTAHRDEVVKFMRATSKGWHDFIADSDLGAELAVTDYGKSLGLDIAQQKASGAAEVPLLQSDVTQAKGLLTIDLSYLKDKVYPSMQASGVSNLPDVDTIVDTTVLADVYRNGLNP